MGNAPSFLDSEKQRWRDHSLVVPPNNKKQKHMIDEMKNDCQCVAYDREYYGFHYRHWLIADGEYILEFDGDDIYNATIVVHHKQLPANVGNCRSQSISFSPVMRERAKKIVGATSYSLLLRNCEHVVTYIVHGVWRSLQTSEQGLIFRRLQSYLMNDAKRLLNTPPTELLNPYIPDPYTPIHKDFGALFSYISQKTICDPHKSHFNILVIGPTGTGKSDLINLLFNRNVVESKASLFSVTQCSNFLTGTTLRNERVAVADTMGLCDTVLTSAQVHGLVKQSIKNNLVRIHKVLFLLPTRFTQEEAVSCKEMVNMLKLSKHKKRVLFLINKTTLCSEEDKANLIGGLYPIFNIPTLSITTKDANRNVNIVECVDTKTKPKECIQLVGAFMERDNDANLIQPDTNACVLL